VMPRGISRLWSEKRTSPAFASRSNQISYQPATITEFLRTDVTQSPYGDDMRRAVRVEASDKLGESTREKGT
jgi:hypothetical protein